MLESLNQLVSVQLRSVEATQYAFGPIDDAPTT
jgi:hypothetical protein